MSTIKVSPTNDTLFKIEGLKLPEGPAKLIEQIIQYVAMSQTATIDPTIDKRGDLQVKRKWELASNMPESRWLDQFQNKFQIYGLLPTPRIPDFITSSAPSTTTPSPTPSTSTPSPNRSISTSTSTPSPTPSTSTPYPTPSISTSTSTPYPTPSTKTATATFGSQEEVKNLVKIAIEFIKALEACIKPKESI